MTMVVTWICVTLLFVILVYFYSGLISQKSSRTAESLLQRKQQVFSFVTLGWLALKCGGNTIKVLSQVGKMAKVVEFSFGNKGLVAINDLQLAKELFQTGAFSSRPLTEIFKVVTENSGVIFSSGKHWKEQRKFCHQHLKQMGFGSKSMQTLIQQEIHDLLEKWSAKGGEAFSPNKDFYVPLLSSLWVLLVGERVPTSDAKLMSIMLGFFSAFRKTMNLPEFGLLSLNLKLTTINRIAKRVPIFPGIIELQQVCKEYRSYYKPIIEARKQTLNYEDTATNLQDQYLMKIHETTDINSSFFGVAGEKNLTEVIQDFLIAGGDTTANMLTWGMLHLIRNPRVQETIRMEIDAQVGKDRQPCLQDIPNCPYTFAFILELLRFSPVAAASLPHVVTEDTNVGPYIFRKNNFILLNTYSIQHDPLIWGDPENFRPERFLSADGRTVVKNEAMCIFSVGQRRCLGEQVGYDNLFLFISSICQRFILHPDPLLKEPPSLEDKNTGLYVPKTFHMVAEDRTI